MKTKFFNALSLAVIMAMLLTSLALADSLIGDALYTAPGTADNMSATLAGGTTMTYQFGALISNTGGQSDNVFPGTVNVDVTRAGDWLSNPGGTPDTLNFTDYQTTKTGTVTISVPCDSKDTVKVITVVLSADPSTNGKSLDSNKDTVTLKYNITAGPNDPSCAPPPPSDTTAPFITPVVSGTLGNNGWYTSDVTVSWTVVDNESAISSSSGCDSILVNADTAGTTLTCTATSAGGTSSESVTINRDATAPIISASASPAPNANGWNNTNVTVSFSGSDGLSGIASCDADVILSSEGAGQSATGSCTDLAGNSASATASDINIDKTAPTLAPTVSPNPVVLNGSATASPNASDSLSGVASSSCDSVDTSSVGSHSVNCTATDNAGNTSSASASYGVVYNFAGFFQPVDNLPAINIAKAGQAIPLKWRLTDANGNPVLNLTSVKVTVAGLACATGTSTDLIEEYAAGASGLQNLGDGYYQFNWKTPTSYASSCKTMYLNLSDGALHTALFQFKK